MTLRLGYVLTPQGRLSPGRDGQSGNTRDIHQIIPGSTIRGALGAAWWTSPDDAYDPDGDPAMRQASFDRFFGEVLSVGPAEPTLEPALARDPAVVRFTPNSVLSCKYDCGATPLDRAQPLPANGPCCAPEGMPSQSDTICPACERCRACASGPEDRGIKAVEGKGWEVRADIRSFVVRSALVNGTPKDNALFTRAVLEPHTRSGRRQQVRYAGLLTLRGEVTNSDVAPAVAWLRSIGTLRVGGSLGTMGKCLLEIREVSPRPEISVHGDTAIYLTTPAVFVDSGGVPTLDIRAQMQAAARTAGATNATVDEYWFRPSIASGWHGLAGLPKPQDPAVDAGAVVVVRNLTAQALSRLLDEGVGLRRAEGFGRVTVDPGATEWATTDRPTAGRPAADQAGSDPIAADPAGAERHTAPAAVLRQRAEPTSVAETGVPERLSVVAALLGDIPAEHRTTVERRLLDAVRKTRRMRESGNAQNAIDMHVSRTLSQPWARDLSGPLRDRIRSVVSTEDLLGVIVELESRTAGTA